MFYRKMPSELLLERKQALNHPGVGKAAHLMKQAVTGYRDAPYEGNYNPYDGEHHGWQNKTSIICGHLVVKLRRVVMLCGWTLFGLSFFEAPYWCRDVSDLQTMMDDYQDDQLYDESKADDYGDCKILLNAYGATADGEEYEQLYPNTNTMWLTIKQSRSIEILCICFVSLFLVFEFGKDGFAPYLFFYPGYKRWTHAIQCISLICLLSIDTALNPFLRMFIICSFQRKFQHELGKFLKMIPEMRAPMSMLAIIILSYSWFGVVIFYNTQEGLDQFSNLPEGVWTLWSCVTTVNYPDVMMPAYNENRGAALYFISFMVLSFFYMMNLILAVAVNAYEESHEIHESTLSKLERESLSEAYTLLDYSGENEVSKDSIMQVMTILNQDIPEIETFSQEQHATIFAFLDKDYDGTISKEEFLDFGSVLLLNLDHHIDDTTFVSTYLPSIFQSNSYQKLCKFVKSQTFEVSIEIVLILNAVIILAEDYPMLAGREGVEETSRMEGVETIFTVVYTIEAVLKIMVYGWKHYIQSPRNCFDFIITVVAIVATAYVYYPNDYNNPILVSFVVMARVLRLTRLLFNRERFQLFGHISLAIIPAATSIFIVLLFLFYMFSSLGVLIFGGIITRDPANPTSQLLLECEVFVDSNYFPNNFNDMFSGLNVLFNWLVVNNWTTQTEGMEYATENKWLVRLFFLCFYILGVIGISNVITSFVINAFFHQLGKTLDDSQVSNENISRDKSNDKVVVHADSGSAGADDTSFTRTVSSLETDYVAM